MLQIPQGGKLVREVLDDFAVELPMRLEAKMLEKGVASEIARTNAQRIKVGLDLNQIGTRTQIASITGLSENEVRDAAEVAFQRAQMNVKPSWWSASAGDKFVAKDLGEVSLTEHASLRMRPVDYYDKNVPKLDYTNTGKGIPAPLVEDTLRNPAQIIQDPNPRYPNNNLYVGNIGKVVKTAQGSTQTQYLIIPVDREKKTIGTLFWCDNPQGVCPMD